VQQQQRRLFPHDGSLRHKFRALDIEEQLYSVHRDVHGAKSFTFKSFMLMNGAIKGDLLVSKPTLNHTA
jgi:hypothetical protein